jgi:hypothetical protein
MAKILVKFSDVFNDVDIVGFKVMTDIESNYYQDIAEDITWPFTFETSFGEIEFLNGESLISKLEFEEISNDEYKMIKRVFGDQYGIFVNQEYLEYIIDEEDGFDEGDVIDEDGFDDSDSFDNFDDYSYK